MVDNLYDRIVDLVNSLKKSREKGLEIAQERLPFDESIEKLGTEPDKLDLIVLKETLYERELDPLRPQVMRDPDPELHERFSQLNDHYMRTNLELKEYLRTRYSDVDYRMPSLVDMALRKGGIDLTVIKHLLKTRARVESGQINEDRALEQGLNFTKEYYNMPNELINGMRQYIKNADGLNKTMRVDSEADSTTTTTTTAGGAPSYLTGRGKRKRKKRRQGAK